MLESGNGVFFFAKARGRNLVESGGFAVLDFFKSLLVSCFLRRFDSGLFFSFSLEFRVALSECGLYRIFNGGLDINSFVHFLSLHNRFDGCYLI